MIRVVGGGRGGQRIAPNHHKGVKKNEGLSLFNGNKESGGKTDLVVIFGGKWGWGSFVLRRKKILREQCLKTGYFRKKMGGGKLGVKKRQPSRVIRKGVKKNQVKLTNKPR